MRKVLKRPQQPKKTGWHRVVICVTCSGFVNKVGKRKKKSSIVPNKNDPDYLEKKRFVWRKPEEHLVPFQSFVWVSVGYYLAVVVL